MQNNKNDYLVESNIDENRIVVNLDNKNEGDEDENNIDLIESIGKGISKNKTERSKVKKDDIIEQIKRKKVLETLSKELEKNLKIP